MTTPTQAQTKQAAPSPDTLMDGTNMITVIADIKPGHLETLRAGIVDGSALFAEALEQVGTVHFVRWAIISNGTQLLLATTYDGDMMDYLDDFWEVGGEDFGRNTFGHCEGFPEKLDHDGLVRFVLDHAVETLGPYSNYPGATCKEIHQALRVRKNMEAVLQDFQ